MKYAKPAQEQQRIQKVLAHHGVGSRRDIERWINEGKISVNGKPAKLGMKIGAEDTIQVNQRKIVLKKNKPFAEKIRIIALNKASGFVCSRRDPEGRPTVFDKLPSIKFGRWVSVGRLDINTTGLLLFTNSGELANILMHPAQQIEREYIVRVRGEVTDDILNTLRTGVQLEDGLARFTDIQKGKDSDGQNHWFYVVLTEGKNREVRRLWESQGIIVSRLKRVRFGHYIMPSRIKMGRSMQLSEAEAKPFIRLLNEQKNAARQAKEKSG